MLWLIGCLVFSIGVIYRLKKKTSTGVQMLMADTDGAVGPRTVDLRGGDYHQETCLHKVQSLSYSYVIISVHLIFITFFTCFLFSLFLLSMCRMSFVSHCALPFSSLPPS